MMTARHRKTNASWEESAIQREQSRTCPVSGKRMYAKEDEAKATAAHRMAEKETAAVQLRTYKCLYCETWHLTSKEP
jgi:hypothetical protein